MPALRAFAERLVHCLPARLQPMARWRFIKFGMVGASGTVINVVVLYAAQEFLLRQIADFHTRLNHAITLATLYNFYWNRRLTWRDRARKDHSALFLFAKYVMAAALATALQPLLTKWLAQQMHYIVANLIAIGLASVVSFVANDGLTFRRRVRPAAAETATHDEPAESIKSHD
jgi:dolichol-phosphate mannosyltransferase